MFEDIEGDIAAIRKEKAQIDQYIGHATSSPSHPALASLATEIFTNKGTGKRGRMLRGDIALRYTNIMIATAKKEFDIHLSLLRETALQKQVMEKFCDEEEAFIAVDEDRQVHLANAQQMATFLVECGEGDADQFKAKMQKAFDHRMPAAFFGDDMRSEIVSNDNEKDIILLFNAYSRCTLERIKLNIAYAYAAQNFTSLRVDTKIDQMIADARGMRDEIERMLDYNQMSLEDMRELIIDADLPETGSAPAPSKWN